MMGQKETQHVRRLVVNFCHGPMVYVLVYVYRERSDWNVNSVSRPDRNVMQPELLPRLRLCQSKMRQHRVALVTGIRRRVHRHLKIVRPIRRRLPTVLGVINKSCSTTTISRDLRWRRRVAVLSATMPMTSRSKTYWSPSSIAPSWPTYYSRSVSVWRWPQNQFFLEPIEFYRELLVLPTSCFWLTSLFCW